VSPIVYGAIGLLLGIFVGLLVNRFVLSTREKEARETAERRIKEALEEVETTRKEMLLEAKAEILNLKADAEEEVKERRKRNRGS